VIYPVPKPPAHKKVRGGKRGAPTGRPRTRMKNRNAKRKGSAFPKQRNPEYRRWIWTENPCMLRGATIRLPFSTHDVPLPAWGYIHACWGDMTPAHVGKHQAP